MAESKDDKEPLDGSETGERGGGVKMAEEQAGETTFSPTDSPKEQLNAEQSSQNNF